MFVCFFFLAQSSTIGIIPGLKETFIKRHILERTNEAEIRQKEQFQKMESCLENLWNEIRLKVPQRQKQTQERHEKEWASLVGLCQT